MSGLGAGEITALTKGALLGFSIGAAVSGAGLLGAFGSTFALTVTNPMTIVSFIAVFAGLGIGSTQGRPAAALLLVVGVIAGSAAWWFLLSGGVSLMRSRFDAHALTWVNRAAAAIIAAFGVVAVGSVVAGEGR